MKKSPSARSEPVIAAPVVETPAAPVTSVKKLNPIKLKQIEDRLKFAEEEIPRLEDQIVAAEGRLGSFVSAEQSQKDAAEA